MYKGFVASCVTQASAVQRKLWIFQTGKIVLDSIPLGVVLFTSNERAIYANRAAEAIFRENDGLLLKAGVLTATDTAANVWIQLAIRKAARVDLPQPETDALLVERKSMRRSYQIVVLAVRRKFQQSDGMGTPAALLLITDPEREPSFARELLRKLYGLTPKEALLGEKLATGVSLEEAASQLSIEYETARTHLKRIYNKIGISRQSELAALIGRLPKLTLA